MKKRGSADHFNFEHPDNDSYGSDTSAGDWSLILAASNAASEIAALGQGLDLASVHAAAASNIIASDANSEDAWAGPEAAAAGGKPRTGSGGGPKSGTSTGTTGSDTSGTGTGQGATTTVLHDIPIQWQTLAPSSGDTALPTDTYFYQEWNLTSAIGGINVTKAWQNYTGLGVKIGIVDDGIDYNHSDLNSHYLFNLDYDSTNGGNSAFGSTTDGHGTTVAGVLAAARDGSGIVGVAYNASIAGFRISYTSSGPSQLADAINHLTTNGMDVGNASWGYSTPYQDNFYSSWSSSGTAIQNAVANGRGGLGINIVFSPGNNRPSGDNVNYHNYQNNPYVIAVAATDDFGFFTWFGVLA